MNAGKLTELQISPEQKRRPQRSLWVIFLGIIALSGAAAYFAWPRASDQHRVPVTAVRPAGSASATVPQPAPTGSSSNVAPTSADVILTVSGYIINRERIELSPRFLGVVSWIGVKKGDPVTNGQVVVRLDDTEYVARLREAEGRLAAAKANAARAELDYERIQALAKTDVESKKSLDDARLQLDALRADVIQAEGALDLARTYVDWTVIRSPVNGVVLEKLVNPNELVVPQSFGGTRGPSTALIAVANRDDLQVEIDINESDLSKISLNQKCRVSPEAYPDKIYPGYVAEIAPEANRSKGTLQIKVQIQNPDRFLTPELSAKVEFLK